MQEKLKKKIIDGLKKIDSFVLCRNAQTENKMLRALPTPIKILRFERAGVSRKIKNANEFR